jgi:hypothetical protein
MLPRPHVLAASKRPMWPLSQLSSQLRLPSNFVTEAAIPSLALERHAGEERHARVDVVIDNGFTLGVVLTM